MSRLTLTAVVVAAAALSPSASRAQPRPQTIIQYFETSWAEITRRMPEIAAAGYTAIWLPPPTKGAEGTADVGFSVFDRFDLGDRDQRGTVATKYGTKEEVIELVREAHRFGIQVYFDIVMNHNANPGKIENSGVALDPVPIDGFPGTVPLDYHVLPARDVGGGAWEVRNPAIFGGNVYALSPNTRENEQLVPVAPLPAEVVIPGFTHLARAPWIDFSNAGRNEELHLSLLGLIDFAIEQDAGPGGLGPNDAWNLVAEQPLPRYVRLPERPETYPGGNPVPEDIREYLVRWIQWFGDTTNCDGLRLDAIKHVPTQFFARDFAGDPIAFNWAFQDNLDLRRGTSDADDDDGIDDALLFGESFTGDFGSLQEYRNTGMYLLDFPLLFRLAHDGGVFARWGDGDIGQLSFPQGGMTGAFNEFGGLGRTAGVSFVQSHDTDAPTAQADAAYAFIHSRVGHSVVFFDGNNFSSRTFVRAGRIDALGELGSDVTLELLDIRRRFARGGMFNRYVDGDVYIYERVVETVDGSGGATLLVAITDSTTSESRFGEFDPHPLVVTEFPPGTVLTELTGHGAVAELTVLDPAVIPEAARSAAIAEYDRSSDFPLPSRYGLVYLQIPAGPTNGFVMYAPRTPPAVMTLSTSGGAPSTVDVETAGPRQTPSGAPIGPAVITASEIGRDGLTVSVATDATAARVYLKIDAGGALGGLPPVAGSAERMFDGFVELEADPPGTDTYVLRDVDVSGLSDGVHLITARVALDGAPVFFSEVKAFFVVTDVVRPDGGVSVPDAGSDPEDGGGSAPDASGPPDSGVPDPDPDRDGIPSASDLCPGVADPDQADFDADRVGDACDLCPETDAATLVDETGCAPVDPALRDALDAIVRAILEERFDATLDVDKDGAVDARDFALRAAGRIP